MSLWGQLLLQDASSSIMQNMIFFHDYAMMIVMMIIMLLFYILVVMLFNKFTDRMMINGQMIEVVWTIIPMIFLIFLAFPSLHLLYLSDEIKNPIFSIKVIGHQWYWSYEYGDFNNKSFDSYIVNNSDDKELFRLLDVDNYMVLPINCQIRFLVSAVDVIHSFTIPSLGMKVDAVPGRINQISMMINRYGVYFGQCSEICGVNHSFMPIGLECVSWQDFINWVTKY
uniref:Cytochrome c oxidase subunit 2 n=1 Tax=Eupristina koningsbergeri TaxID=318089 RepID=A0A8A3YCV0_9HYME|nr:cytochrome c oxidase subunit II [Eupristina koningsbergeri]